MFWTGGVVLAGRYILDGKVYSHHFGHHWRFEGIFSVFGPHGRESIEQWLQSGLHVPFPLWISRFLDPPPPLPLPLHSYALMKTIIASDFLTPEIITDTIWNFISPGLLQKDLLQTSKITTVW